jgi:FAD/FMN-containing dehydrogenase
MAQIVNDEMVNDLRLTLAGSVIVAADAEYDSARRCFNALVDRRPAVIARCTNAADVATALRFAQSHALEIAVRGGGHNPAGHCVCDGGLVIDLSQMRAVEVDGKARIAYAQGGATWLDFDTATQEFGLVTPGGVVVTTGVAGLSMGGGIGHLTAQYGLTCDHIVGAEVVTPDGSMIRANADENPELLWGLRGGGGNFGVVTRLDFRLHPLERVMGGLLLYKGDAVREVLRLYRDIVSQSPRDLSCQVTLSLDMSLQPTLEVAPCYTGTESEPADLRALRSAPGLVSDSVETHSFLDQQRVINAGYGTTRHYWKGHFLRELPDELIDELVKRMVGLGRPTGQIMLESLHGAPKDPQDFPAAVGFRHAAFNLSVMAAWQAPAIDVQQIAWARETAAAVEGWSFSGGGYINYMQADEPIERLHASFGAEAFERLRNIKQQYDPGNVLRRNQNIPPATDGVSQ